MAKGPQGVTQRGRKKSVRKRRKQMQVREKKKIKRRVGRSMLEKEEEIRPFYIYHPIKSQHRIQFQFHSLPQFMVSHLLHIILILIMNLLSMILIFLLMVSHLLHHSNSNNESVVDDLDIPIALRKCVQDQYQQIFYF